MAVGLILGLSQANAYTTENLVSDGWSLVTSLDNNKDYVYVFVDAGAQETAMVRGATPDARPRYNTICNPIFNKQEVWAIEKYGDNYAILGIEDNYYFSTGDAGWNDSMTDGVDGNKGLFSFTRSGEKYDIRSVAVTGENNYMGPWNNEGSVDLTGSRDSHDWTEGDGMEDIAVNKSSANAPGYRLYKMSKTDYLQKYLQQYPNLEAPIDVSYLILNSKIYQGGSNKSMPGGWDEYECETTYRTEGTGNTHLKGYDDEVWKDVQIDYFQTLDNLPGGKYRARAAIRDKNSTGKFKLYLFQNGKDRAESDAAGNSWSEHTTSYLEINSGSINIGVRTSSDAGGSTLEADNFRMEVDPYLSTIATEFTNGSTLTAGIWYYFELATTDAYDFLSSAATTLTYTCAETPSILVGDKSEETFADDETKSLDLTAGRVYFKVSEATTLTILFRYTIGSPAADKSYIQPGNMVTVSYASLSTNDPSASADIDFSGVTLGGEALDVTPTSNGFTFTVPDIEAGQEYTLSIPAESIGYDEGSTYNAAQNITLNTIAIYDGVYYMYNTYTNSYLSRSGNWATQAILDNYGLAVNISTDENNLTKIQYFDSQRWLGDDGFCYGDCTGDRVRSFNVTAVAGGYKFMNTNNSKYLAVYEGQAVGDAVEGGNLQGTSNIWALESTSEHIANYTVNANVQAAEAASNIPSLSSITTKAELDAELTASYNETPIAITGSKKEKFNQYASRSEALNENTYYSETKSGLKPGLYKLSVDAFQRAAGNDRVAAADGARGIIYLYAGTAKTQLKSVMDYGANEAYTSDFEYNGKHYPDDEASAYVALATGNYKNEVYVYVADSGDGTGSLEFGIKNPTRAGDDLDISTWAAYDNWTLTYYDQTAANMTITSAKYATFVAPFDVEIPSGVTAYTVDDVASNGFTLEMTEVTSGPIEKNTPVVLYSESTVNETFYGKTVDGTPTEGLLTGVYERTEVPNGSYVLQNNGGKVGFYLVDTSVATPSVNANRAYLTVPALVKLNAYFFDDGTATAIQSVFDSAASGEVYDIAGRKLGKLQKGVNIVNGKKVLVK